MSPRQLDLGPIATLTKFSRLPIGTMIAIWIGFGLVLIAIFFLTRR